MLLARFLRASLVAGSLWLAGVASGTYAQSFDLTLDQARGAATQAALAGNFVIARDIAAALLRIDQTDRAALIVLAVVEPRLGRPTQGRMAGVRAYRESDTLLQKYEAARLTALAAAGEDRLTLAQYWLRRAAIVAPTPQDLAQTRLDYRGLRARNPWQSNIQLSFAPSNNVNGGSDDIYNIIEGLPFIGILSGDAQALSGFVTTADLRLGYRLRATAKSQTTVSGRLYGRGVWLSDDAKVIAPTSSNGNFMSVLAEGELRYDRALENGQIGGAFALGQSWYGGAVNYSYARISADRTVALTQRLQARFSGLWEQRFSDDTAADLVRGLDAGLSWTTPGGAQVTGSLGWDGTQSAARNGRSEIITAQFSYVPAKPVGPADIRATLGVSHADYPDYSIILPVPGGRQDITLFGSLEMAFPDYGFAGFAPVVTIAALRADSNVSRFSRNEVSLRLGIRSSF